MNGRATDSQFAQNPLPIARAMGIALARFHQSPVPNGLTSRTDEEVANALSILDGGATPPAPFTRYSPSALTTQLGQRPQGTGPVHTHGAPVVDSAVLVDSIVTFESAGCEGFDAPERDLAIVIRSIAETFTSEVAATFIEGYVETGGELPKAPALDWYGLVAAFR